MADNKELDNSKVNDKIEKRDITSCPFCGNDDFCTQPNSYDVYQIIQGLPQYIRSEMMLDEFRLYCRECGEQFPVIADQASM